uniref:CASP-like protein n=1 Tax=Ascaris lumbricoides TaxID=6252 RepID=A0A0M3I9M7_ASCLU
MDIIDESRAISTVDYAVFVSSLFLSVGTGIYHAISQRMRFPSCPKGNTFVEFCEKLPLYTNCNANRN